MKSIFISIGIVVALMLIGLIAWILLGTTVPPPVIDPIPVDQFPSGTGALPSDDILTVATTKGALRVRNFLADEETVADPVNKGYYYLGNHFPFDGDFASTTLSVPYTITYIESTQYFNISLFAEPISKSRMEAEKYLLDHVGITKEQMCILNYMVSVPNFVSPLFAGDSLGFSFCPGAIEI